MYAYLLRDLTPMNVLELYAASLQQLFDIPKAISKLFINKILYNHYLIIIT